MLDVYPCGFRRYLRTNLGPFRVTDGTNKLTKCFSTTKFYMKLMVPSQFCSFLDRLRIQNSNIVSTRVLALPKSTLNTSLTKMHHTLSSISPCFLSMMQVLCTRLASLPHSVWAVVSVFLYVWDAFVRIFYFWMSYYEAKTPLIGIPVHHYEAQAPLVSTQYPIVRPIHSFIRISTRILCE